MAICPDCHGTRHLLFAIANLLGGATVVTLATCVRFDIGGLVLIYVAFAIVGTLERVVDHDAIARVPSVVPTDWRRAIVWRP